MHSRNSALLTSPIPLRRPLALRHSVIEWGCLGASPEDIDSCFIIGGLRRTLSGELRCSARLQEAHAGRYCPGAAATTSCTGRGSTLVPDWLHCRTRCFFSCLNLFEKLILRICLWVCVLQHPKPLRGWRLQVCFAHLLPSCCGVLRTFVSFSVRRFSIIVFVFFFFFRSLYSSISQLQDEEIPAAVERAFFKSLSQSCFIKGRNFTHYQVSNAALSSGRRLRSQPSAPRTSGAGAQPQPQQARFNLTIHTELRSHMCSQRLFSS